MPYLIIIRGPLGCGKTTISKKLKEQLNAEYFEIDKILEELNLDNIPDGEPCIPLESFITANKKIIPIIQELLNNNINVIIDGNFYFLEAVENVLNNINNKSFVFTLKAPLDLCIERDKNRPNPIGEEAAMAVYNLVSRFDYGMNINVDDTMENIIKNIINNLK